MAQTLQLHNYLNFKDASKPSATLENITIMTNYNLTMTLMFVLLGYVAILLTYNLFHQFKVSLANDENTKAKAFSQNNNQPLSEPDGFAENTDPLIDLQYDLQNAIANDELQLHYQIKVDSITRAAVGAEALLRWQHPIKGLLHPADFMRAADRYDLSYAINKWVIEESCRTLRQLNDSNLQFNISINMSHHQIANANFVHEVTRQLKRFNLDSTSLSFDLTEVDAQKNQSQLNDQLKRFKDAGINIAIDDFGMHSSNTTNFENWQVNELKLAPNFTFDVANSNERRDVVQSVIALAHRLKLNVVAEGVETENQRKVLAELGCDQMQGFLINRPLPEERFIQLLKNLNPANVIQQTAKMHEHVYH